MAFKRKIYKKINDESLHFFVNYGYLHIRGLFNKSLIDESRNFFLDAYNKLENLAKKGIIKKDIQSWGNAILDKFSQSNLYSNLIENERSLDVLEKILGPDIAILNFDHLWMNFPNNSDPVLKKEIHTDTWTGTGVNTLLSNIYFTNVDQYNSLTVFPGSHLQGIMPVLNRKPDPKIDFIYEPVNLHNLESGDFLIWHSLLLHSTTGNSNKNIRISMSSRYTSTLTPFTTQELSIGHRSLRISPMKQIGRLIGNDFLTPFRTYGGYVGIEKRLSKLYKYSNYDKSDDTDYIKYL